MFGLPRSLVYWTSSTWVTWVRFYVHLILKQTFPPFRTPYLFHLYFHWPCFVKCELFHCFFSVFVNCFKPEILVGFKEQYKHHHEERDRSRLWWIFQDNWLCFFQKANVKCERRCSSLTNGGRGNITNARSGLWLDPGSKEHICYKRLFLKKAEQILNMICVIGNINKIVNFLQTW